MNRHHIALYHTSHMNRGMVTRDAMPGNCGSVPQDLISEVTPIWKCRVKTSPIFSGYGAVG